MRDTAVIVIAKASVPGRVKTRLCPPCSQEEAAVLAAASLADTLAAVSATPAAARVLALDGRPGAWIPDGWVVVPQLGGGLDERLADAFAAVTGPAVLIGMDTPQVSPALLTAAAQTLHTGGVDAVIGPADDGGWWTIGMHAADPRVFLDVPMSTDHTYDDQRARLQSLGLNTSTLPRLRDIDTYEDALAVAKDIPSSRFAIALADVQCGVEDAG
jgi:rSAM/selenodomain-associated transferase 1